MRIEDKYDRADRIFEILRTTAPYNEGDASTGITTLLADIMFCCKLHPGSIDFEQQLEDARIDYQDEMDMDEYRRERRNRYPFSLGIA